MIKSEVYIPYNSLPIQFFAQNLLLLLLVLNYFRMGQSCGITFLCVPFCDCLFLQAEANYFLLCSTKLHNLQEEIRQN